jgi:hypothetical protein
MWGIWAAESRKPTLRCVSRCVGALEPEAKLGDFG